MSASDKAKLNSIEDYANNYILPEADNITLGGVKIGANITSTNGTISVSKQNVTDALGYDPVNNVSLQNEYAKLNGPNFSGTPTVPTAEDNTNSYQIANTQFVQKAIAQKIESSPEILDTLTQLTNKLGEDKNLSATLSELIGNKLDKTTGGVVNNDVTINGTFTASDENSIVTKANKLNIARRINLTDADGTNSGTGNLFDGSEEITLKLPATIKATLSGNATTATKATNDNNGNAITSYAKDIDVVNNNLIVTDGTGNTTTYLITDTKYNNATSTTNGLMSQSDKIKLDNIEQNANNYTLPQATSTTLGGIKTGSNITNTNGQISITKQNVLNALGYMPADSVTATANNDGLISASDKNKLDSIEQNANNYTLPTASNTIIGGVKIGTGINVNSGTISVNNATSEKSGLVKLYSELGNSVTGTINQATLTEYLSRTLTYQGTITSFSNLSQNGNTIGDTYTILNSDVNNDINAGDTVLWTGTKWIKFLGSVDLSKYVSNNDNFIIDISVSNNKLVVTPNNGDSFELSLGNDFSLSPATKTVLGGIKVGNSLSIDENGTLSVDTTDMLLKGTPQATSPDTDDNSNRVATTNFVKQAVSNLVDSTPEVIETLEQLHDKLDEYSEIEALTQLIGEKLPKTGGTVSGDLTVNGKLVANIDNANTATYAHQADIATKDVNGNNLTSYIKSIDVINNKITVTDGTGETNELYTQYDYDLATATKDGLLAASDKKKLDNIEEYANNYTLPTASNIVLGGIKTGNNITNTNGTISVNKQNVIDALGYTPIDETNIASSDSNGLMSTDDKTKLDSIEQNANNYTLPVANATILGGVKIGNNITNTNGNISITKQNVTDALGYTPIDDDTITNEYAKLDSPTFTGIPTVPSISANNNSLQIANTQFVHELIDALTAAAPQTLNAFAKLAQAINNNPNFGTEILEALDTKLSLSGGIVTGDLTVKGKLNANASTASKLNTAVNINISDNESINSGNITEFDGSNDITIKLPTNIKANLQGNADSASVLKNSHTISISGGATGTATAFDGSSNINIPITALDASKLTGTANINISGNATTATRFAGTKVIDGLDFDGSRNISHYCVCNTFADQAVKKVICDGFNLITGASIIVSFTNNNYASNVSLNVNETGDIPIYYHSEPIPSGILSAGRIYQFVYDGTVFNLIGDSAVLKVTPKLLIV